MKTENKIIGKEGEEAAVDFLEKQGYKILERNFKNKLGEIDVVARDKKTLCFIEVKTRTSLKFGYPQEAVTKSKQKQLNKVALSYLKQYNLIDNPARFDIISVIIDQNKTDIVIIKDAFPSSEIYS